MSASQTLGENILKVEVTNISTHGIWLVTGNRELFLDYDQFPWFKDVPIRKIINVEEPSPGHFYWPELDVDLGIESIEHPERFPLVSKDNSVTSGTETTENS